MGFTWFKTSLFRHLRCDHFVNSRQSLQPLTSERGAVMVQMAIIAPLMVLLVGGTVDYGILLKEQGIITEASRVGARKAAGLTSPTPEWVCIMSTDIAREYLNSASIAGSEFTVTVDRQALNPEPQTGSPLACAPHKVFDGTNCVSVGVRVTVSRPPRFYLLPWHATLSSASTTFIQEDGIGPSNPCSG